MVNGLGVLGWGVGGIEAEAAMLGQAISMLLPRVVGIKLIGALPARRDRDRPRAHRRAAAARARRGRQARGVLRRGCRADPAREPGDDRQHVARVRLDVHDVPRRRRDAALPARDRPSRRSRRARRDVREGAGPLARPRCGPAVRRDDRARPHDRRAVARRSGPPARPRLAVGREGRLRAGAGRRAPRRRRDAATPEGAGRAGRRARVRSRRRRGRDRGDHVVHEHVEPVGDDRGRPARPERGGARPHDGAVGEDVARARLARGHRLLREGRTCWSRSPRSASTSSATAAPRASATPARSRPRSRRRSPSTTSRCAPCCPATATSKAASIPTAA